MKLASVDLNLLVALDALLAEPHVTRAASRLGLSQPGMSNTLARLRKLFGDPLSSATASSEAVSVSISRRTTSDHPSRSRPRQLRP